MKKGWRGHWHRAKAAVGMVSDTYIVSFASTLGALVYLVIKALGPHQFITFGIPREARVWYEGVFIFDKGLSIAVTYAWPLITMSALFGIEIAWQSTRWVLGCAWVFAFAYPALYETVFRDVYIRNRQLMTVPVYIVYFFVLWLCGWRVACHPRVQWPRFYLFFTFPMACAGGLAWLYDRVIFDTVWTLDNDTVIIVIRLLVHPVVMAVFIFSVRMATRRLVRYDLFRVSFLYVIVAQWMMVDSLYGRLLILSLRQVESVVLSILGISISRIVFRSTFKEREAAIFWLGRRLCCCFGDFSFVVPPPGGGDGGHAAEELQRQRSDYVALDIIIESFAVVIIPLCIVVYRVRPLDIDATLTTVILQLAAEFVTDCVCVYIDDWRGVKTIEHWNTRQQKSFSAWIFLQLSVGMVYVLFSFSAYIMKIKHLD